MLSEQILPSETLLSVALSHKQLGFGIMILWNSTKKKYDEEIKVIAHTLWK